MPFAWNVLSADSVAGQRGLRLPLPGEPIVKRGQRCRVGVPVRAEQVEVAQRACVALGERAKTKPVLDQSPDFTGWGCRPDDKDRT